MKRIDRIDLRFPEGRAKCLTLSYDDGVEQDIRLCRLMRQHGIAGTFNINSGLYSPEGAVFATGVVHRRMSLDMCHQTYASELFEVATHGLHHKSMETLPVSQISYEVTADRRNLEAQFGRIVRGHAYPYGKYTADEVQVLQNCGIVYARTICATHSFDLPENWLILDPTCRHKDPQLMELTEQFLAAEVKKTPYLFYLWGHSYEFEADNNWNVIEEFFERIAGCPEVWYATNIQVYDYVQAYRSLIYSADAMTVYNPTITDVWLSLNTGKKTVKVPAGQTVSLESEIL